LQEPSDRQDPPTFPREIILKWRGRDVILRITTAAHLSEVGPQDAAQVLFHQISDLAEVGLTAMSALADDLYSRIPEGSREFEKLMSSIGLKLIDTPGDKISVANHP